MHEVSAGENKIRSFALSVELVHIIGHEFFLDHLIGVAHVSVVGVEFGPDALSVEFATYLFGPQLVGGVILVGVEHEQHLVPRGLRAEVVHTGTACQHEKDKCQDELG